MKSPERVVDQDDPGDETARRFSYQWAYTAVLACGLLDTDGRILEVYCEHHEDILVKRRDGQFNAIQVKTRQLGSELWKTNDEPIWSCLLRFCRLEQNFGPLIWRYTIATNHQFFSTRKNGSNLLHLLSLAQQSIEDAQLDKLTAKIARAAKCDQPTVFAMLKKTNCDHTLPKLGDIHRELCEAICRCAPGGSDSTYSLLKIAADLLISEVQRASSLHHEQSIPLYLSLREDAEKIEEILLIDGKRFTPNRVITAIQGSLKDISFLSSENERVPRPLDGRDSVLIQKLGAGGLSAVSVHAAQDLHSSAFRQQREWAAKYGEREALRRYQHVSILVLAEAALAYEASVLDGQPFGRSMLRNLADRLKFKRLEDGVEVFGSTSEHLLGHAYILTDDCRVWWSEPFDLEEES